MNKVRRTLLEWFVERSHSTNRSTPRTRPSAPRRSTATDNPKVLVNGSLLVGGRRLAATIRGRDARLCGAVLLVYCTAPAFARLSCTYSLYTPPGLTLCWSGFACSALMAQALDLWRTHTTRSVGPLLHGPTRSSWPTARPRRTGHAVARHRPGRHHEHRYELDPTADRHRPLPVRGGHPRWSGCWRNQKLIGTVTL
jgi:hypothetical protein